MLGKLYDGPYQMVQDPERAEVAIVSSYSFIQPTAEDLIKMALQMVQIKEQKQCKNQVVTGLMVQHYGHSSAAELPEVDFFLDTGEVISA